MTIKRHQLGHDSEYLLISATREAEAGDDKSEASLGNLLRLLSILMVKLCTKCQERLGNTRVCFGESHQTVLKTREPGTALLHQEFRFFPERNGLL